MYVCVYVCICVFAYAYASVCVRACVRVCVSVFVMYSNHTIPVYRSPRRNMFLFIPTILSHIHFLIFIISFFLEFYLISCILFSRSPPSLPPSLISPTSPYLTFPSLSLSPFSDSPFPLSLLSSPLLSFPSFLFTPLIYFNRHSMWGPADGRSFQRKSSLS